MKTRLLSIFLALFSLTTSAQSVVISNIAQKLNDYYQFYPSEKVQLTTDKEVYKTDEIIWFSALITNANGQQVKPASSELQVGLYSANGIRIASGVYKTHEGLLKGDLMIPKGLDEGKYVLTAHTSLMSQANEVFYKKIYLNPKNEEAIRFKAEEKPTILIPGKSNTYSFAVEEMDGTPGKKEKLEFELMDGKNILLSDKIKTDDTGKGILNLTLPDKNFEQPLKLVVSTKKGELNYASVLPVKSEQINLKFYPEGGKLIAGLPQKVGFTAHNEMGQPVSIAGQILDKDGNKMSDIKTLVPGFGVSSLSLEKGEKYTLHITSELGENQTTELPAAEAGFSMAISRTDDDFIYANLTPASQEKTTLYLLANKGDEIFWASEVQTEGTTRIKIPKNQFPQGISLLSAFNQKGQPIANRLVFIASQEVSPMALSAPEKVKAEEVFKFVLETPNPADIADSRVNLSMSAAEENPGWTTHWNTWLFLNSDLETPIPDSEKLLSSNNVESTMNYLLIANQIKNFEWHTILNFDREWEQNKYQQSGIFGQVTDKNHESVPNAKVSFMNAQNMQTLNTSTDKNGEFYQQAIDPKELENFAIKAIGPDGSENLQVTFQKSLPEQISEQVKAFINTHASLAQMQFSSDFYQQNPSLFTKIKVAATASQKSEPSYKKFLQTATSLTDVIKTIKPFRMEGDKIIFPGGTNSINAQDGALIVLDGQKMGTSASVLNSISPLDVETINISTNPVDIQRYTGLNSVGLIEIQTKRGQVAEEVESSEAEKIEENGYRIPRDFWLKKSEQSERQPTTLLWNPAVKLNSSGRSEFEIATNQVLGKFIIRADVISPNGKITQVSKIVEVVP